MGSRLKAEILVFATAGWHMLVLTAGDGSLS